MEALGGATKARRTELGLTQEDLADRMAELGDTNIRQSDISRIETGQVQLPRYERLVYLAQALEMTLVDLFTLAGWAEERWPESQPWPNDRTSGDGDSPDDAIDELSKQREPRNVHNSAP